MKSILVPTDFSECAAAAYNYAVLFAERSRATIYLLHVLDIPAASLSMNGQRETRNDTHFMMEMMKLTKARMTKIRNGKIFKSIDVKEIIEVGSIPERIYSAVKKHKIDMVVMGTHGVNGLQERFIGTNAEKIVRNVEVPVLSVKHVVKRPKLDTIVFATDFSKESETIFPVINSISKLLKARLVLTKIITIGDFETTVETENKIQNFKTKNKLDNFLVNVYYAKSKEQGIRDSAGKLKGDMIVLGTHGRSGLSHFFRGSVAEDVVSHASFPVLTINFRKSKPTSIKMINRGKKIRQYDSDFLYQIPSV